MRLYLIRHGETDWNRQRRLQGHSDIPLNEAGRQEARAAGERLKKIHLDCAFTSPLKRARETAQLVLGGREIPLYEDARIREIGFGVAEGEQGRDQAMQPTGIFAEFFYTPESYVPPRGGEDVRMLCSRTWSFLEDITSRKELQEQSVLIATHGAALQSMLLWIKKLSYQDFWKSGLKKNCSVTVAEVRDGQARLLEEGEKNYQ